MALRRKKATTSKKARKPASKPKSRKKGGNKKGRGTILSLVFAAIIIAFLAVWIWSPMVYVRAYDYVMRYYRFATIEENTTFESTSPQPVIRTEENYGAEIDRLAKQFDLSPEFLKSLIILECSGLKKIKPRFERHVYKRLENVRDGKLDRYENLKPKDLHDATDGALKNMASSWGPFQIMGYKCVWLDIQLADLRGEDALYWGVKWIDLTYGDYVRKGKFKDAFHIHNTGRPYPDSGPPKTYDSKYVPNGLMYMKHFEALKKNELAAGQSNATQ
jgi:hypothetical protein